MIRRTRNLIFAAVAAALLLMIIGGARAKSVGHTQDGAAQQPPPKVTPKRLTTDDLRKLRWIVGTWRGTGDVDKPFFERYYFENDSTLAVEGFPDETVSKADDVTRFVLKDGHFGNTGEGSLWAATALDDNSITFEPLSKARNTFRWERRSKDVWKAVLSWPASADKPARQRVYTMERWAAPKKQ